jgi:putative transposase
VLKDAGVHVAPSTYYDNRSRQPSKRAIRDASIIGEIERVHKDNYGVYGIRKVHAQLAREGGVDGVPVARCTVARLMREMGLRGAIRGKPVKTTIADKGLPCPLDRVIRFPHRGFDLIGSLKSG